MASFTMEMLLKKHGLEHRLRDTPFTNLISHKLRLRGWRQRKIRFQGRHLTIWSDYDGEMPMEVKHHAQEDEELTDKVTGDCPVGVMEHDHGWFD